MDEKRRAFEEMDKNPQTMKETKTLRGSLNQLDEELEALYANLDEFIEMIDPVLSPDEPKKDPGDLAPEPGNCSYVNRVEGQRKITSFMIGRILHTKDRLRI